MFRRPFAKLVAVVALGLTVGPSVSAQTAPVRIGVIYSYSGAAAPEGKALDAALDAWLAIHHGKMAGRAVQLIRRDDTGPAPDVARRQAQELVMQEHVDFLMGALYTPNALAIEEISAQSKVPFFITNAATAGILARDPYAARFSTTMPQAMIPLARWAAGNGIKSAYIVVSDYAPGIDSAKAFSDGFTAAGGKIAGELHVPLGATDFSAYIQRVRDAKPEALYAFVVAGSGAVNFFKTVKSAGLAASGMKILASGATVDESDLPVMGDSVLGVTSSASYSPTLRNKLNDQFLKAFAATIHEPNQQPDFMAEAGYDALSAIERCVQAQPGALDADRSMSVVRGLKLDTPRGLIQIDAQTRDIIQNVYIRRAEQRGPRIEHINFLTVPMVPADMHP